MIRRALLLLFTICFFTILTTQSLAQNVERRQSSATPSATDQPASLAPGGNSIDAVANEIDLLRKSVQTLNLRLREISDKLSVPDLTSNSGASSSPNEKQKRIAASLELLARAEERAGILRKQLVETIEKETSYKSRLAQMDEDMRPENIERSMSGVGSTRTAELRDVKRRSLDIEKRGTESLLSLATQNHLRLEEDVRQADALVSRLRQRLFPLIDKEIEKLNPN